MKTSIHFPSGDGSCAGDLYLPEATPAPSPVVIMAHGIGAERSFGLEPYARRFLERGMAVLVFDYRHFGDSPGEPRNLVQPSRQVTDYLAAVDFVRGHGQLDGDRVGFWGTSFSGGHVLTAAAGAPSGLRAVVSQVPFVSGISSTLVYPLRYQVPALVLGALDRLAALTGRPPLTVPLAGRKGLALLASPDSFEGFTRLISDDARAVPRVPARVFLEVLAYRPAGSAPKVKVPTLVVAATEDALCPVRAVRTAARRIPEGRLEEFPIGHFEPYFGEWFQRISQMEADFLQEKLRPMPPTP